MHDLDAIEAINIDQLVTPLDRLLLRNGHVRRAPTRRTFDLAREAELALAASAKRQASAEHTIIMRAQRPAKGLFRMAALAVCVTWLSVAFVCLLA